MGPVELIAFVEVLVLSGRALGGLSRNVKKGLREREKRKKRRRSTERGKQNHTRIVYGQPRRVLRIRGRRMIVNFGKLQGSI